jgi:hypothetical protein
MKKLIASLALAASLVLLTSCDDGEPETTGDEASIGQDSGWSLGEDPAEGLDEDTRSEISRLAMQLTFDTSTPEDRRNICLGLALYGREWSKDNLQALVPLEERDDTDWDASVDYLEERCAEE